MSGAEASGGAGGGDPAPPAAGLAAPTGPHPLGLAEQIADLCGEMILDGRIAAGERLPEALIVERFRLSRASFREALRLLERRGLVEFEPRRGARARPVALRDIADLFDVRIALACLAARGMAADPDPGWRATLERRVAEMEAGARDPDAAPLAFSRSFTRAVRAVIQGAGNALLPRLIADLDTRSLWLTLWRTPLDALDLPTRRARAEGMRAVARALDARDPARAEAAMRAVFEASRDAALAELPRAAPALFASAPQRGSAGR